MKLVLNLLSAITLSCPVLVAQPPEESFFTFPVKNPEQVDRMLPYPAVWEPSKEQVRISLKLLEGHLKEEISRRPPRVAKQIRTILKNYKGYRVQIVGFQRKGSRLMYLNFFTVDKDPLLGEPDWKSIFMIISDGGASAWRILFDPEKKRFIELSINGEA